MGRVTLVSIYGGAGNASGEDWLKPGLQTHNPRCLESLVAKLRLRNGGHAARAARGTKQGLRDETEEYLILRTQIIRMG